MEIFKLPFVAYTITEPGSKLFKAITCNDLAKPKNAILDRFGKCRIAFYQHQKNENELIITFHEDAEKIFEELLAPYKKLSKATIEKTEQNVYWGDIVVPKEINIPENKGQIIITEKSPENTMDEETFTLLRLSSNMPWYSIDFKEEVIVNITTEYVSTTKGCYPGQEVIARILNLAKPSKKMIVAYKDELSEVQQEKMTSCVKEKGREKGFCIVSNE